MKILSVCIHPHQPARLRGSGRLSLADLRADPSDPVDLLQGRVIGSGAFNDVDRNHRIQEGSTIQLRQEGIREISVLVIGER